MRRPRSARSAALAAAALVLAGCASVDPERQFSPVQQAVQQHTGADLRWARSDAERADIDRRVAELLKAPLDSEAAVQVALLNHRGLQARFAALGIAEAEVVQAMRLPNPGFAFGRTRAGDEREIERSLHLPLLRWLLTPWTGDLAQRRLDRERHALLLAVLDHAAMTRKAWVEAVAAQQSMHYMGQVMQAAEAAAELARRMQQVGNFSALQRAREQAFYADAALNVARAEQQQRATRERLTRLMGLWGAQTAFTLPDRLPDLPADLPERPQIEREALATRLDLQAAQVAVDETARALGLTRATRLVSVVELGLSHNSSNDGPTQRGWEVDVELPLFDWGDAKAARAEAVWRQAIDHAAQLAIDARSQIREAEGQRRSAWLIARHHRDEIVPLRAQIAEQNVLRYNGMLIGVFELLADARAQIASVHDAIQAERDFWLADADLRMATLGSPTPSAMAGPMSAAGGGDAGGH
ncbi:MAG: TolC family protein [Burkholderiaceae bacterium]|nr:TolC family protein [Burkholderiaceae bacterium]